MAEKNKKKWGALHEFVNGLIRAAFDVFPDQGFKFWAQTNFHFDILSHELSALVLAPAKSRSLDFARDDRAL